MFKVVLLVITCFFFADARLFDKLFQDKNSYDVGKRSFPDISQVCQSIKEEKIVKTSTKINGAVNYYPDKIATVRCKIEGEPAAGVIDKTIFCKTKEREIDILKIDENYMPFDAVKLSVPVDCVAYRSNY